MSEYVDVDIIENGKVIGTFKCRHVTEEKTEKIKEMKNKISMALKDPILQQGFEIICKNLIELEKENAGLRAAYDKQKEINKELVDDIAALQRDKADLIFVRDQKAKHICELKARITELETQIKLGNEREAQDIRARFPC